MGRYKDTEGKLPHKSRSEAALPDSCWQLPTLALGYPSPFNIPLFPHLSVGPGVQTEFRRNRVLFTCLASDKYSSSHQTFDGWNN